MKRFQIALVVVGLTLASSAFAQDSGGEEQFFSFEDDFITGDLMRPDGETIDSMRSLRASSLIRIRTDFIPELVRSVEDPALDVNNFGGGRR